MVYMVVKPSKLIQLSIRALWLFCLVSLFSPIHAQEMNESATKSAGWQFLVDGKMKQMPRELQHVVSTDSLQDDLHVFKSKILEYYYARGYLSAEIDSITLNRTPDLKKSHLSINRGCRYTISRFEIEPDSIKKGGYASYIREGTAYRRTTVEKEIDRIINHYEEKGYPLVKVFLDKIQRNRKDCSTALKVKVNSGPRMRVNDFLLPSLDHVDTDYIRKASGVADSALITPDLLRSIRKRLQNTGFFSRVGRPEIVVRNDRNYLQIPLEERNPNLFDLVLGYNPQAGKGGTIVGDGKLRIRNIFWPGSTTRLQFERLRRLVTKLHVGFKRDWILGVPLGAGIRFKFLQQDTSYQVRNLSFKGSYALTGNTTISGQLRRKVSVGNESLRDPTDVLDAEGIYAGLGIDYQQLDDPLNPTSGIILSADLQTGVKTISDERAESDTIGNRIPQRFFEFEIQPYLPTFRRQVLTFTLHGFLLDARQMTKSDLKRFGGTQSLRGYREDQFRASRVVWGDLEYRYLLDPSTYGFIFGGVGYFHRPRLVTEVTARNKVSKWLYSWGLGFSYNTRIGRLRFTYAVSPEDAISNGKVHFGIVADL